MAIPHNVTMSTVSTQLLLISLASRARSSSDIDEEEFWELFTAKPEHKQAAATTPCSSIALSSSQASRADGQDSQEAGNSLSKHTLPYCRHRKRPRSEMTPLVSTRTSGEQQQQAEGQQVWHMWVKSAFEQEGFLPLSDKMRTIDTLCSGMGTPTIALQVLKQMTEGNKKLSISFLGTLVLQTGTFIESSQSCTPPHTEGISRMLSAVPFEERMSIDMKKASIKCLENNVSSQHHYKFVCDALTDKAACVWHGLECPLPTSPADAWIAGFPCSPFSSQRHTRSTLRTEAGLSDLYEYASCADTARDDSEGSCVHHDKRHR
eukprot:6492734-Amphidinium_carterae.2